MFLLHRFVDIPVESCGVASPMRVALQASQPDILLILLRYVMNLQLKCNNSSVYKGNDETKPESHSNYLWILIMPMRI